MTFPIAYSVFGASFSHSEQGVLSLTVATLIFPARKCLAGETF